MHNWFKKCVSVAIVCGMLVCSGCGNESKKVIEDAKAPDVTGDVQVTVLDIGKADCIVIQTENYNFMIDTGEKKDADEIEEFLQENGITKIDYLELTHYDKDHIGGLRKLLKNGLEVEHIYAYDNEVASKDYDKMMEELDEHNLELEYVEDKKELQLDDLLVTIYAPMQDSYQTAANQGEEMENEFSLVTKLVHGENKMVFAGDACNGRLAELPEQMNLEADFLKVPHHGRADNSTSTFTKAVSAKYAVITDSDKNLADDAVIKSLEENGATVYETRNGQVDCVSDGKDLKVTQTVVE